LMTPSSADRSIPTAAQRAWSLAPAVSSARNTCPKHMPGSTMSLMYSKLAGTPCRRCRRGAPGPVPTAGPPRTCRCDGSMFADNMFESDQLVIAPLEPAAFDEEDAVLQMDGAGARVELFGTTDAGTLRARCAAAWRRVACLECWIEQAAGSDRARRGFSAVVARTSLHLPRSPPAVLRPLSAATHARCPGRCRPCRSTRGMRRPRHVQPLAQARMDLQVLGDGGGVHSEALFTARTTRLWHAAAAQVALQRLLDVEFGRMRVAL